MSTLMGLPVHGFVVPCFGFSRETTFYWFPVFFGFVSLFLFLTCRAL